MFDSVIPALWTKRIGLFTAVHRSCLRVSRERWVDKWFQRRHLSACRRLGRLWLSFRWAIKMFRVCFQCDNQFEAPKRIFFSGRNFVVIQCIWRRTYLTVAVTQKQLSFAYHSINFVRASRKIVKRLKKKNLVVVPLFRTFFHAQQNVGNHKRKAQRIWRNSMASDRRTMLRAGTHATHAWNLCKVDLC